MADGSSQRRHSKTIKSIQLDENLIVAHIIVGNVSTLATIDTGASRSCVSERFVRRLGNTCTKTTANGILILADTSEKYVNQALEERVQLGNSLCDFRFYVMPETVDDVLLGMDFLLCVGASFSCGGETISIQNSATTRDEAINEIDSHKTRRGNEPGSNEGPPVNLSSDTPPSTLQHMPVLTPLTPTLIDSSCTSASLAAPMDQLNTLPHASSQQTLPRAMSRPPQRERKLSQHREASPYAATHHGTNALAGVPHETTLDAERRPTSPTSAQQTPLISLTTRSPTCDMRAHTSPNTFSKIPNLSPTQPKLSNIARCSPMPRTPPHTSTSQEPPSNALPMPSPVAQGPTQQDLSPHTSATSGHVWNVERNVHQQPTPLTTASSSELTPHFIYTPADPVADLEGHGIPPEVLQHLRQIVVDSRVRHTRDDLRSFLRKVGPFLFQIRTSRTGFTYIQMYVWTLTSRRMDEI